MGYQEEFFNKADVFSECLEQRLINKIFDEVAVGLRLVLFEVKILIYL